VRNRQVVQATAARPTFSSWDVAATHMKPLVKLTKHSIEAGLQVDHHHRTSAIPEATKEVLLGKFQPLHHRHQARRIWQHLRWLLLTLSELDHLKSRVLHKSRQKKTLILASDQILQELLECRHSLEMCWPTAVLLGLQASILLPVQSPSRIRFVLQWQLHTLDLLMDLQQMFRKLGLPPLGPSSHILRRIHPHMGHSQGFMFTLARSTNVDSCIIPTRLLRHRHLVPQTLQRWQVPRVHHGLRARYPCKENVPHQAQCIDGRPRPQQVSVLDLNPPVACMQAGPNQALEL